jgi:hypothetical protein
MKATKVVLALLAVFVSLPIGFYLQFRILGLVNATNVMWLLFWANVPSVVLFQIVTKLAEISGEDE